MPRSVLLWALPGREQSIDLGKLYDLLLCSNIDHVLDVEVMMARAEIRARKGGMVFRDGNIEGC